MKHVNVHAVHELDQFSRKCLPKDVSASGGTTPWRAFQPEPEAGDLPVPTTRRGWVAADTASGSPGSGSVAVRGGGRRAVELEQAADQGGDGAVAQRAFVDPQPPATGVGAGPGDLGLQDGEHQAADGEGDRIDPGGGVVGCL